MERACGDIASALCFSSSLVQGRHDGAIYQQVLDRSGWRGRTIFRNRARRQAVENRFGFGVHADSNSSADMVGTPLCVLEALKGPSEDGPLSRLRLRPPRHAGSVPGMRGDCHQNVAWACRPWTFLGMGGTPMLLRLTSCQGLPQSPILFYAENLDVRDYRRRRPAA